jgi:hypothetical protein
VKYWRAHFSRTVNEKCPGASPVQNHNAKTAGFSLAGPRDTLLDDATAEVGVDDPALGIRNHPAECRIPERSLSGEPGKRLGLEYPQRPSQPA